MKSREALKIKEVESKLDTIKSTYSCILAIWNQVDRKRLSLATDIKILEDELLKLRQGQLIMDFDPGY